MRPVSSCSSTSRPEGACHHTGGGDRSHRHSSSDPDGAIRRHDLGDDLAPQPAPAFPAAPARVCLSERRRVSRRTGPSRILRADQRNLCADHRERGRLYALSIPERVSGVEYSNEQPSRPVPGSAYPNPFNPSTRIPFEIARRAQVRLDDGACLEPAAGETCNWGIADRDDHPVNCISWYDAVRFAARLPTEAVPSPIRTLLSTPRPIGSPSIPTRAWTTPSGSAARGIDGIRQQRIGRLTRVRPQRSYWSGTSHATLTW